MGSRTVRIFLSAGEPSGDVHAANLVRELARQCPRVEAVGYGGPEMAAAGVRLHAELTRLAVMWFARALLHLPAFWELVVRADRYFHRQRPDAVVLVDYPGLNWWIARRAKVHGIPVFYYPPPQIWAWGQWRVRKMRRLVDHVLCTLPFEEAWFRAHGCRATCVGHPFFDEVRRVSLDEAFLARQRGHATGMAPVEEPPDAVRGLSTAATRQPPATSHQPLVLILPGSRTQEVAANFPDFLKAAGRIQRAVREARFAVAAFKPQHAEMVRGMIEKFSGRACPLNIEVHTGRTPELMHLADCAMACSGSVSLELLYHAKPTVILYRVSRLAYLVQGFFRQAKYITLVNLLANEMLFPEYLTCEDRSAEIAGHVIEWLSKPEVRCGRVAALERLRLQVAHPGASRRAAEIILRMKDEGGRPISD
jgi:lipid-A-disaccharide synthase